MSTLTTLLLCLSTPYELSDIDRLHLLTQRLIISELLDDKPMIYQDSNDIYELITNDPNVMKEFQKINKKLEIN